MMRSTVTALMLTAALVTTGSTAGDARESSSAPAAAPARAATPVTLPAGTVLRLRVTRGFGSDISRVEDPVTATLARSLVIDGRTVLPAGSTASGYVSEATRPGKVKGRGRVAVRFTRIDPEGREAYSIRTRPWVAIAPATKKKDALTIGIPAAGGAAVGALIDGKKGAGIGAAVGGGAGTAAVLTTRGKDVRIGRGALITVRLSEPLTLDVR